MRFYELRIYLFILTITLGGYLPAQTSTEEFSQLLLDYARESSFNGNVLVARGGEILLAQAIGMADFAEERPLDTNTVFRLASVSKQFTALGIALLAAEGKLAFDDPLTKYLPELDAYPGVTIRHLIHHYGGLPDYMNLVTELEDFERVHSNNTIIELMAREKPEADFAAGTDSEYSNTGYLLLASVIERVSGESYGVFLQRRVFQPLGMSRTSVPYPNNTIDANRAWGYEFVDEARESPLRVEGVEDPFGYYILADVVGDGMVHSTLGDLWRYTEAMRRNELLSAEQAAVLLRAGDLEDSPEAGYAFGQMVAQDEKWGTVVEHSGAWAGYLTFLERHPDAGNAIIILSNNGSDFDAILRMAHQFLRGDSITGP